MNLTLRGNIPSKKNSRRPFIRGGRILNFPSKEHEAWHREAILQIGRFCPALPYAKCRVEITFYPATRRRSDLTNKAESIMDLLVDSGFIIDDNWFAVPAVLLKLGTVDPQNPRAEIVIEE